MENDTILLVDEPGQVEVVAAHLAAGNTPRIIAVDYWARAALTERGIDSAPLNDYLPAGEDFLPLLLRSQEVSSSWYRLPQMSFFKEGSIEFGEALEPAVDYYLKRIFYLRIAVERILAKHPECKKLVVAHTRERGSIASGPLAYFELSALADAARFEAARATVAIDFLGDASQPPTELYPRSRASSFLKIYNALMRALIRQKPLRIYASEYWRNLEPFLPQMNDAELVLMDRSEAKHIPWHNLFALRVRLMHPLDEMSAADRKSAHARALGFKDAWKEAREAVRALPGFTTEGVDEWPLVERAFAFLVEFYSERMLADTAAFRRILKRERTNRVVLRASMSARQTHFYLLAKLAHELAIPSIELQHAGEMSDPLNAQSRLTTDYLAGYGKKTRSVYMRNHNYKETQLRLIGSPRFDLQASTAALTKEGREEILTKLGLDPSRPVALIAVPALLDSFPAGPNSYEIVATFEEWKRIQEGVPGLQYIFKFRAGNGIGACRDFLAKLFPKDAGFAEYEAPYPLMQASDVVFSGASTMHLEALIAKRPALAYPLRYCDAEFVATYGEGIFAPSSRGECVALLTRLFADKVFYAEAVTRGTAFLETGYCFDGHSSERLVALLREPLRSVE